MRAHGYEMFFSHTRWGAIFVEFYAEYSMKMQYLPSINACSRWLSFAVSRRRNGCDSIVQCRFLWICFNFRAKLQTCIRLLQKSVSISGKCFTIHIISYQYYEWALSNVVKDELSFYSTWSIHAKGKTKNPIETNVHAKHLSESAHNSSATHNPPIPFPLASYRTMFECITLEFPHHSHSRNRLLTDSTDSQTHICMHLFPSLESVWFHISTYSIVYTRSATGCTFYVSLRQLCVWPASTQRAHTHTNRHRGCHHPAHAASSIIRLVGALLVVRSIVCVSASSRTDGRVRAHPCPCLIRRTRARWRRVAPRNA